VNKINIAGLNKPLSYNLKELSYVNSRELAMLNIFWGGFVLYVLSYVFKGNPHMSQRLGELLQLLGLFVIFISAFFVPHQKIENRYLALIFFCFLSWTCILILRGFKPNFKSIMYMVLSADYGGLLYAVPLVLFLCPGLTFLKKLFDVTIILGIFFFIAAVLFKGQLLDRSEETKDIIELLARNLALPSAFILLTYKYHSNRKLLIALFTLGAALLFAVYKARRGLTITLSSALIFSFFSYFFYTRQKVLIIYLTALFVCLGLLYVNSIYDINNNKLLNSIVQRGDEDTRTGVELYFYNDMHTKDWIIGRGMNGEYYCPGIDDEAETDYRPLIETGYLQIILKGGLVRLILFLLIAIPAVILGLFYSKNLLSKAAALWVLIALISLYPATVESFSLQYVLVWISIGLCYSKNSRNLSDNTIEKFLKPSK
jgi:hypothetical protein